MCVQVAAGLVILEESSKACLPLREDLGLSGKIVLIPRGGCLFVQKVNQESFVCLFVSVYECVCCCTWSVTGARGSESWSCWCHH